MPTMIDDQECYTTAEAAALAEVSVSYMSRQAKNGKVPAKRIAGSYFFPIEGFNRWLAGRKGPGRPKRFIK